MNLDVVSTVLTSLGGATVIIGGFAHLLGKIWTDRIAKETSAKFTSELEVLKSKNTILLEEFKSNSAISLKENEQFALISQEFYQDFFNKRVRIYQKLLNIKNEYVTDMEEEFITEQLESWGNVYHSSYIKLRSLIIKNQLYISNDLDALFTKFRSKASEYIKEADLMEAYSINSDGTHNGSEALDSAYQNFANETYKLMTAVFDQIGDDVSKLRSRVEIDKV